MSDSAPGGSLSISSLLLVAGIIFLVVRYFLSPSTSSSSAGSGPGRGTRVNIAAVEQVAAMFPQLDRRAIAWDLQRNGGNAQASVERVLTRGSLDTPPPSFQPQGLNPAQAVGNAGVSNANKKPGKTLHQDLITKYKLSEKLRAQQEQAEGSQEEGATPSPQTTSKGKSSGWSQNKGERASLLQQRREAMILAARRKMEDKDRREIKGKGKEVVDGAI